MAHTARELLGNRIMRDLIVGEPGGAARLGWAGAFPLDCGPYDLWLYSATATVQTAVLLRVDTTDLEVLEAAQATAQQVLRQSPSAVGAPVPLEPGARRVALLLQPGVTRFPLSIPCSGVLVLFLAAGRTPCRVEIQGPHGLRPPLAARRYTE